MARRARVVVPGNPHYITQRGNRRQQTFFTDNDYEVYIDLMSEWCKKHGVSIWAYCLMPNHVHLIAVPKTQDSLHLAIGEAHLAGEDDKLVKVRPLLRGIDDWKEFLSSGLNKEEAEILRAHERTGRPLGSERFLKRLEKKLGRFLQKKKAGRPKKKKK